MFLPIEMIKRHPVANRAWPKEFTAMVSAQHQQATYRPKPQRERDAALLISLANLKLCTTAS